MEARAIGLIVALVALANVAATHRTPNFVVHAPTDEIARQVGEHAEMYRRDLAITWLGRELPPWYKPCPITVKVGQVGAGGATSFSFDRGEVFGWQMNIQGPLDRILDSVLPHEVSHTIFACYFRRPLPRWADEGAATLAEADSERQRQAMLVRQILQTRRRIPLKQLLRLTEYPSDMQDVMTLYAEGYALCDLLVQRGGRTKYLSFLNTAHKHGWESAIQSHYGFRSVEELEKDWEGWIMAGCPPQVVPADQQLADVGRPTYKTRDEGVVMRSQSPDENSPYEVAGPSVPLAAAPARKTPKPRGYGLEAPDPRRNRDTAAASPARSSNPAANAGDRSAVRLAESSEAGPANPRNNRAPAAADRSRSRNVNPDWMTSSELFEAPQVAADDTASDLSADEHFELPVRSRAAETTRAPAANRRPATAPNRNARPQSYERNYDPRDSAAANKQSSVSRPSGTPLSADEFRQRDLLSRRSAAHP